MRKSALLVLILSVALFARCTNVQNSTFHLVSGEEPHTVAIAQGVEVFPQLGHSGPVASVAFSPDGRQIISGSYDNTVKLWDIVTGRVIRTFSGHSNYVHSVAFSPDGRQVISGSVDKTVKLWDLDTGRELKSFSGHSDYVLSVAFSPDGRQILSGSADKTVKLWNLDTGRELRSFSGHSNYVHSVAFSPDGKQILSGSSDKTVKLWDLDTGRELKSFSGHSDIVYSVAFSPDGRQFVSGSQDDTIKLWDIATDREIWSSELSENVYSVAFSPDGKQIVSGFLNDIKLWDASTGRELRSFSGHSNPVVSVTFSPDGSHIISGSADRSLKLWDAATGLEIRTFSGQSERIRSVAFSPDGRQILSGSSDKTVKLWDTATGREIKTFSGHSDIVTSVAFSPDGKQIISGSYDNTIKLWDLATGREIRTFEGHSSEVYSVAFGPDGRQILSGSSDKTVKLWDLATGREIRTFSGHSYTVYSVAFSPDGRQILSGSSDKTVKLWDLTTGREIRSFSGHSETVSSVAFSPDGRQILSGSTGGSRALMLQDITTGREIRSLSGYNASSIAFSPDGRQIISSFRGISGFLYFGISGSLGSEDQNTIKLWDIATGREIKTLSGHSGWVSSVVFSPDGKTIASGSNDGTTRLWETSTGKEIAQFISFTDGEWIVITPDGYYNASPGGDRYLNVREGNNIYGMDQFSDQFYKPLILEARLQGRPDPEEITQIIQDVANFTPPEITIRSPSPGSQLNAAQAVLSVVVEDQNLPIKEVQFYVNSRLVGDEELSKGSGTTGIRVTTNSIEAPSDHRRIEFSFPINLVPGQNSIKVIAWNEKNSRDFRIATVDSDQGNPQNLPNLWIMAVGVNKYDMLDDLRYAVNDAYKIVDFYKTQEGTLYNKVNSLLITDDEPIKPTAENIKKNLKFLSRAGQNDVIYLFLAGHGVNENNVFYFCPSDFGYDNDGTIRAIEDSIIMKVREIPCTKIIFLDTCHSQNVSGAQTRSTDTNNFIRNLKERGGTYILASSTGEQKSWDYPLVGHGVFTWSILQGLKGNADPYNRGEVTLAGLFEYVYLTVMDTVKELYKVEQKTVLGVYGNITYFPLARY